MVYGQTIKDVVNIWESSPPPATQATQKYSNETGFSKVSFHCNDYGH